MSRACGETRVLLWVVIGYCGWAHAFVCGFFFFSSRRRHTRLQGDWSSDVCSSDLGRAIMNLALFTYFIPAAFLAVPMYKTMGNYGLLNNQWALILAMVTIAAPYSIWVLKQASDKLPYELDEAARMDGASPLQLFRLVYVPLMMPSLVAIGTYALLLAWNEYLYAFLLLSHDRQITLAVALGNFLAADDSPWELLMTVGLIYALPPAAIYYAFKRYMVAGLTAGAVKT